MSKPAFGSRQGGFFRSIRLMPLLANDLLLDTFGVAILRQIEPDPVFKPRF
jgi:hypothetical protein